MAISELFFIKRFPFRKKYLHSKVWTLPQGAEYENLIKGDNFIIEADLKSASLEDSSLLKNIQSLKEDLLPTYFSKDNTAKYHQSQYIQIRWILVIISFVGTLFATAALGNTFNNIPLNTEQSQTTATPDATTEPPNNTPNDQTSPSNQKPSATGTQTNFGVAIISAILAAITTIYTAVNQREDSRSEWYKNRIQAEELRRNYFLYLSHLAPYDKQDYERVLNIQVANIDTEGKDPLPANETLRPGFTPEELTFLMNVYTSRRVKFQRDFFEESKNEFKNNSNFIYYGGLIGGAFVGVLSIVRAYQIGDLWGPLIIALVPIFVALLNSFEKIYSWGRQIPIYEDAYNRLVRILAKYKLSEGSQVNDNELKEYITKSEDALKSEVSQWGQLASE